MQNIVVPSLQEDFEALGLQVPGKKSLTESNDDYDSDDLEEMSADDAEASADALDEDDELSEDEEEVLASFFQAFEEAGIDPDSLSEEEFDGVWEEFAQENELAEGGIKIRRKARGAAARAASREAKKGRRGQKASLARASRQHRKSAKGKLSAKRHARKLGQMGTARVAKLHKQGKRLYTMSSEEQVADLIEGIEELVGDVDNDRSDDAIRSFRFIEEIAEMLSGAFAQFHEQDDSQQFDRLSEVYGKLNAAAGHLASGLEEEEFTAEDAEIVEAFQRQMKYLLDGAELYESLTDDSSISEMCSKKKHEADADDEGDEQDEENEGGN